MKLIGVVFLAVGLSLVACSGDKEIPKESEAVKELRGGEPISEGTEPAFQEPKKEAKKAHQSSQKVKGDKSLKK
jgi:hypothetical protein